VTRPTAVPHGQTAQRLEWRFLPPHIRAQVEERCGAPVIDAASQGAGFTPGFASVLTCADGSRHFVKAAAATAQRMFADSYREEARKLAAVPPEAPAPRLLWIIDEDWVVLGLEYVECRNPIRPWQADELTACLDAVELAAKVLTPVPDALELSSFAEEFRDWPAYWDRVAESRPDLLHLAEAAELAARYTEIAAGDTVVHTDVRDDNFLIRPDGTALICDWNWPVAGAVWLDSLFTLIGPRGDGIDIDAVIASRPLLRDVPAEHVDIALALIAGYFFKSAAEPVVPTSPHLRAAQAWQRDVIWDWLGERRGWS
jgi:hypothetical protein